jgi:hypothetical protein
MKINASTHKILCSWTREGIEMRIPPVPGKMSPQLITHKRGLFEVARHQRKGQRQGANETVSAPGYTKGFK